MSKRTAKLPGNIFVRMHPLQRILISLLLAAITFLLLQEHELSKWLIVTLTWDVFALIFLITNWVVIFSRTPSMISAHARREDGSRVFVFALILLASFGSLFTVLLLIISKNNAPSMELLHVLSAVGGMLFSWGMAHTIFTFHYAHLYYDGAPGDSKQNAEGLEFPEEKHPDYLDFAYFAFVVGMTFQVSDVQITSRIIRRLVFLHGLLAFGINTFVVALTINIIAGLRN